MVLSIWWWGGYRSSRWLADIGDGTLYLHWAGSGEPDYRDPPAWTLRPQQTGAQWTWWAWGSTGVTWGAKAKFSLWPLAPLLFLGGGTLWVRGAAARRRALRSGCVQCGYSLTGLPAGARCPECGSTPG